jgi:hypothetical protein
MKNFFQTLIGDKISLGMNKGLAGLIRLDVNVSLELRGADGKLKDSRKIHNTVTNAGLYGLMDQMLAAPALAKAGWMEVGTGTGGTTKLNAYVASSRTALTSKTRNNAAVTMGCTFGAGVGTGALTEAGIFDVVTQNTENMWLYSTFATINKAAGDSLTITWTFTAAAA